MLGFVGWREGHGSPTQLGWRCASVLPFAGSDVCAGVLVRSACPASPFFGRKKSRWRRATHTRAPGLWCAISRTSGWGMRPSHLRLSARSCVGPPCALADTLRLRRPVAGERSWKEEPPGMRARAPEGECALGRAGGWHRGHEQPRALGERGPGGRLGRGGLRWPGPASCLYNPRVCLGGTPG